MNAKKAYLAFLGAIIFSLILIPALSQSASGGNSNNDNAEKLYRKQCSKCHRNNGAGIKKVYPPLKGSDYIKNNSSENIIRGMLFGRSGSIKVNGVTYNGVMTTEIEGNVSDGDIAMLLNYVYEKFNSMDKNITASDIKKARKAGKLPRQ